MELPLLLKNLKGRAASRRKEHERVVRTLKGMNSREAELLLQAEHETVFARIDCLACGNCCRTLGPRLTQRDLTRLAGDFRQKPAAFIAARLRRDEDGDLVFKSMPCPFLKEDNFCSVYANRPKACADYPHTREKQSNLLLSLLLPNAGVCPAVYLILESLVKK